MQTNGKYSEVTQELLGALATRLHKQIAFIWACADYSATGPYRFEILRAHTEVRRTEREIVELICKQKHECSKCKKITELSRWNIALDRSFICCPVCSHEDRSVHAVELKGILYDLGP